MQFVRRRFRALLRPGANAFMRERPADEPFCSQQVWAVMMRLYLGCYFYDDSAGPHSALCGHCGRYVLDSMGIYAIACFQTGWGRVAGHKRLAKLSIRWLESPAGLSALINYKRGQARGLLFGTCSRPADASIFPAVPVPDTAPNSPTVIEFMVSGPCSTVSLTTRRAARDAADSSDAMLVKAMTKNLVD